MLVPAITSTGTPASSSTFNTPMWASPRAAPPERATPTFWPRAPHSGSMHAASTRANRFTVCPIEGVEGLRIVASARQSGGRARRNGTQHTICSDFGEVRVRWEELRAGSAGGASIDAKILVAVWCATAGGSRSRRSSSVVAARSAAPGLSGAPVRSAAQPSRTPPLASRAVARCARPRRFLPRFEYAQARILPRHRKQAVAPGAHHLGRLPAERRSGAAAGAYAVGRAPARRRVLGVGQPRHDGPHCGTKREDLQKGARHRHRLPVHLEDAFERRRAEHAVPRAAPHLSAGPDSGPGPLFCVRHDRPPEQRGEAGRVARGARAQFASPRGERLGRGSHCERSGVGARTGWVNPGLAPGVSETRPVLTNPAPRVAAEAALRPRQSQPKLKLPGGVR